MKSSEPMDIIPLSSPDLYVSAVHPQVEVKTSDARQIPVSYTHLDVYKRQALPMV